MNQIDWNQSRVDANLALLKFPSPGDETDEFSTQPCYLCRRPLAGARTVLNYLDNLGVSTEQEWICTDCLMYVAYGEVPDKEEI